MLIAISKNNCIANFTFVARNGVNVVYAYGVENLSHHFENHSRLLAFETFFLVHASHNFGCVLSCSHSHLAASRSSSVLFTVCAAHVVQETIHLKCLNI